MLDRTRPGGSAGATGGGDGPAAPELRDVSGYLVWWTAAPMLWFFYHRFGDWNLDDLWHAARRRPTSYREAVRASLTRSLAGVVVPFVCLLPAMVLLGVFESSPVAELVAVPFVLVAVVVLVTLPANLVRLTLAATVAWAAFGEGASGRGHALIRKLSTPTNADLWISLPLLIALVAAAATYE